MSSVAGSHKTFQPQNTNPLTSTEFVGVGPHRRRRGARRKRRRLHESPLDPQGNERHLYLVFDDWPRGYSIRKVDLSSDDFGSGDPPGWQMAARVSGGWEMVCTGDQRLPPAIFRFEARRGLPMYFAAAFDSKILALQPLAPGTAHASVLEHHVAVFDVRRRSCLFFPRPETSGPDPIYIPAGGRLFALADGTFDWLDPAQPPPPLDAGAEWSWFEIPDPPFKRRLVTSYAVHADGETIFFSIKKGASAATVSFEMEEHGGAWHLHGRWELPFTGRAHFDADLDAWVGLSGEPDSIGHLCSCDVVPAIPDAHGKVMCPARKLSKEKLFSDDPTERHVGATLVYMGGGSKFCLVQCVSIDGDLADARCGCNLLDGEDDSADERNGCHLKEYCCYCDDDLLDASDMEEEEEECDLNRQDGPDRKQDEQDATSRPRRYLVRLTTFTLKYDKSGDLTTGGSCRVRYFRVPRGSTVPLLSNPVAFWM